MEYVIKYNTKLNRLKIKKENWTSKLYKKVKQNKILTISIIAVCMFSIIDMLMIYNFFRVICAVGDVSFCTFLCS